MMLNERCVKHCLSIKIKVSMFLIEGNQCLNEVAVALSVYFLDAGCLYSEYNVFMFEGSNVFLYTRN